MTPENAASEIVQPAELTPENAALLFRVRLSWCGTGVTGSRGPERRQQVIEQRDRGARVDGGALPEGPVPPGLESRGQFLAHLLRGVGVQAAHSRNLVS